MLFTVRVRLQYEHLICDRFLIVSLSKNHNEGYLYFLNTGVVMEK